MIDTESLRYTIYYIDMINQHSNSLTSLNKIADFKTINQLLWIDEQEQAYLNQIAKVKKHLLESISAYEALEYRLNKLYFQGEIEPITSKYHQSKIKFSYPKTLPSLLLSANKGLKVGAQFNYALFSQNCGAYGEYGSCKGQIDFADIELKGNMKLNLFDKKSFDPNLLLEAKASAKLADIEIVSQAGNQYLDVEWGNSVSLFEAIALAEANISKDGVDFDVEAGASIATFESVLTFDLLGIDIELTYIQDLGALKAGFNYGLGESEIEFGGCFSALIGGGFNVKIDY